MCSSDLARNEAGWTNLKELVSTSYRDGYYYLPRVDWELLERHGEGLIALSGGLGGLIARTWHGWHGPRAKRRPSKERFDAAASSAGRALASLFAPGDFYLEFQDTGLPEEPPFNEFLDRKSTRLNSSHVVISYAVFCLYKKKNK